MFSICQDLGIDDPVTWMNSVPPVLVDWWIAYKIHVGEKERQAYEEVSGKGKKTLTGEQAGEYLGKMFDGKRRPSRGTILRSDP